MISHPLPVGARVRHVNQEWPAARGGTATITAVDGPDQDGTCEYEVATTRRFADRPSPDNPEDRITWWSSRATVPATEESADA